MDIEMRNTALRIDGVVEKINYAQHRHNEIVDAIWGTYNSNLPLPQFIGLKTEGLLADLIECFDHLAKDLIECILLPMSSEKTKNQYKNGKLNVYFPFYSSQLTQSNGKFVFHEFKSYCPSVFQSLSNLVDAMDKGLLFDKTLASAKILREAKQLVNEKKHSRVIAVNGLKEGRVFVQGGSQSNSFSIAFDPINKDGRKNDIFIRNGASSKTVPTYKFSTGHEVTDLCMYTLLGTRHVMHHFYTTFFDESHGISLIPEDPEIKISQTPPADETEIPIIELIKTNS